MILWIQRKPWLAGFVAIILFVAANSGANLIANWRLDLTEEKLFTLSDGSHRILEKMSDRPVQVTLFYSQNLGKEVPAYASFAGRVRDMLREFSTVSNGGILFREVDPKAYSAEEDEAVENGVQGLPLEAGGEKVYFGMSAAFVDELDAIKNSTEGNGPVISAIPFFQSEREQFLEYDLMKTVVTLNSPDLPVVGVITEAALFGDPMAQMQGRESAPWAAIGQAQDFFKFEQIFEAQDFLEIKPDILMVAHPGNLHDDMQYAIEQFMMRGGKAVFMMDPWFESKAGGYAPDRSDGSAEKIFTKWGISIAETKIVGDKNISRQVNAGKDGAVFPAPYIVWLEPPLDNLNQTDPTIADIKNLLVPSAGAISLLEGSPLTMEPLISTTPEATLVDIADMRSPDVMKLLDNYQVGEKAPYVIAARLKGQIETAFPEGAPPLTEGQLGEIGRKAEQAKEAGEEPEVQGPRFPEHMTKSEGDIHIMLMADVDFMADRFWVQVQDFFGQKMIVPFADNGAFMLGMLETLNGSGDLMGLRSRGISSRPFSRIDDLQSAAEEEFRAQERELSTRLGEVEKQLDALQQEATSEANIVSEGKEEQEKAIANFTNDMLEIRKELRAVNLSLRENIETLKSNIKFVNIALIPILIGILALVLGMSRRRRYR